MRNHDLRKKEHFKIDYQLLKWVIFYVGIFGVLIILGLSENPTIYTIG